MTGLRMPTARVPFLEMRGGCGRARIYGFPILFYFVLDHTPSRERGGATHAHATLRSSPAADLNEAEEKAQEREKNGTSGVHGGGYFAPHDTNNNFWIFIYVQ
jgi:hypothetical protein